MRTFHPSPRALAPVLLAALPALALAAPERAEDRLIVRLEEPVALAEAAARLDGPAWAVKRLLVPRLGVALVELSGIGVDEALREIRDLDAVRWAQPDHWLELRDTVPDDPAFGSQWSLENFGNDADVDAPQAWDLGTGGVDPDGDEIVVAIVDGGMELTHPDLVDNLWVNGPEAVGEPGVDDDGNGFVDDVNGWDGYAQDGSIPTSGHGTHVAGIVGARGNNGNQVCGINWNVRLMAVAASSTQTSVVAVGYNYVIEQKALWLETDGAQGANVVATNSSFGSDFSDCESENYRLWNELYDEMGSLGILSAAATMNRNADVDLQGDVPTSCTSDWLVTVTNTTNQDTRNGGAAYGLESIDLGAPGTSIPSTYTGGIVTSLTGTSMATPHVAGAVALLHSVLSPALNDWMNADPAAAALELKRILLDTVDPLAALDGLTVSGGRLNLHAAALAASSWPPSQAPAVELELLVPWGARLSWEPVAGASLYHVETSPAGFGPWTRVATTDQTAWEDGESVRWSGEGRFYRIVAEVQ